MTPDKPKYEKIQGYVYLKRKILIRKLNGNNLQFGR
jgi:hypothetical protein